MRYIDLQLVANRLPDGWEQRAQAAEVMLEQAEPQGRSRDVNRLSQIWRDLKEILREASYRKCWYCESIEDRSDNSVDHFRPKNAVEECPDHEGYWWLAFKWSNYRFSCTFCNSRRTDGQIGRGGGKDTRFPLRIEAARARRPTDDLTAEEPMLLDPCVPADPGFLWFDETGQTVPSPLCGTNPETYPYKRAATSIELYHLNQPNLVDQRKALCSDIRRRVANADRYYARYLNGDHTARLAFEDAVRDLRGCLLSNARYSSASRAMLMGLRGTHPVVDVILAAA